MAVIRRTRTTDSEEVQQVAFFTTDHPPEKGCARSFAQLARGHWAGCEIRNHWVREDKTRSKNHNINCALVGLRGCLIAIKASVYPEQSWPSIQERCQRDPTIAYQATV